MTRWLHRFAVLTALATFTLIGLGGLVTSHGVGMAVPDWPNTYGYNMFFFPFSRWVGGVFYEHTHRLAASAVGLLTSALALWLHGRRARPFLRWAGLLLMALGGAVAVGMPGRWRDGFVLGLTGAAALGAGFFWPSCEPSARWLRRLGWIAFLAVVLQGVLGGLRVTEHKDEIGIFHATLAQLFFVLICSIALFTSRFWQRLTKKESGTDGSLGDSVKRLAPWLCAATLLILAQLVLGATMRHQHAGLAIPDFPLAYGKLWPAIDSASIAHYNQRRMEVVAMNPITANQIVLQMVHRITAVLILGAVSFCAWRTRKQLGGRHVLSRLTLVWAGLICAQVLLGAATIWSDKAADIATAHVLVGVLSLATGTIGCIVSLHNRAVANREANPGAVPAVWPFAPLGSPASASPSPE